MPVKVGDRMSSIEGPVAIPAKGAKLTMVNYFASWCESSKRWMPHVEEMRNKHAAAGLAVIGVANYDEAPRVELESFVKLAGASFPVSADEDHAIFDNASIVAPHGDDPCACQDHAAGLPIRIEPGHCELAAIGAGMP